MKRIVCLAAVLLLLVSLCACGETKPSSETAAEWSRQGYFSNEDGDFLTVTRWDDEETQGWYVGCLLGGSMYGNVIPQENGTLHGNIVPEGEDGSFVVTVSEEGEDGLLLAVEGGGTYHFTPMDLPTATIIVTVNTDGPGNIDYAEGEEPPEPDPEYPYQSAQINLAEPAVHTFIAWPDEGGRFVKWTKNGEDFSSEPQITVLLDESADYIAVFEYDDGTDFQNPVMNFIGTYVSGRANARGEADGTDGARITVRWGSSAWESASWVMSGRFDPDLLTVNYIDCVKTVTTYADDGTVESEVTEYEDGTGRVVFNDDGTFVWQDSQSELGDVTFEWSHTSEGIDYLALVNKLNPLPDGWEDALETVTVTNSVGDEVEVEAKAYEAYLALKQDLEENDGIYIELDSARRSVAAQQDIMDRFIEKYGLDYALKTVATPGYSEHHTGLALDLYFRLKDADGEFTDVYYNEDMVQYPEIWEKIHAKLADYGFILRYLEGREHLTGYGYEPWHIRYLDSAEIAGEIMSKDITLEEYLGAVRSADVTVDCGTSSLYTQEELEDAVVQIKCRFASLAGCELHAIRYAGDDVCSAENLAWLNAVQEGSDYTEIAEFLMDFRSSGDASGALEPDTEYDGYQWWLARTEDGGWEIVTWGEG